MLDEKAVLQSRFQFIPNIFDGVEVRDHPTHDLMGLTLCTGAQ